jgi:hypothetical protein
MAVYWLMFLSAAGYALLFGTRAASMARGMQSARVNIAWAAVWLLLTLLIGFRYEVGGDWFNYLGHLQAAGYQNVDSAVEKGDPAYRLLNLLAVRLGWGIAGVNLISASLFSAGLVYFCRGLPRPWLALAVAMPYMVTVVAMGYTRQGVALGLACWAWWRRSAGPTCGLCSVLFAAPFTVSVTFAAHRRPCRHP